MKAKELKAGDRVSFLYLESTPAGGFYFRRKRYLGTVLVPFRRLGQGQVRVQADKDQEGFPHGSARRVYLFVSRDSVKLVG